MTTSTAATIDDLYHVPEDAKAELVNGEIILMSPTGGLPGFAGSEIFASRGARMDDVSRCIVYLGGEYDGI